MLNPVLLAEVVVPGAIILACICLALIVLVFAVLFTASWAYSSGFTTAGKVAAERVQKYQRAVLERDEIINRLTKQVSELCSALTRERDRLKQIAEIAAGK